jgi:hypothetical protein
MAWFNMENGMRRDTTGYKRRPLKYSKSQESRDRSRIFMWRCGDVWQVLGKDKIFWRSVLTNRFCRRSRRSSVRGVVRGTETSVPGIVVSSVRADCQCLTQNVSERALPV